MPEGARPLRICFLMYHGSMESGGQGIYLANVTRALARLGHEVHVISGPPYPTLDPAVYHHRIATHSFQTMMLDRARFFRGSEPLAHFEPLNFFEFATTRFTFASLLFTFSLRALVRLAQLESEYGAFDVIHDNQTLSYGVLAARTLRGRATVATIHHPLDVDARNGLREEASVRARAMRIAWYPWQMQHVVARRLDALIFPSNASAALTSRLWSLAGDRVHALYNGVDTDVFQPGAASEREAGALLFVGNSEDHNKGAIFALRAMALLPTDGRAHLYMVGGPAGAISVAGREIARLNIADRVTVVGRVPEVELAAWYRRAQVLLSPSLYEGFGLPAAEAMASETPVIAANAGALPEVVADGETGILVPPADPRALAAGILGLLANPGRCTELGSAGRARVLDRFTWSRHARGCEAIYRSAIAQRARSRRAHRQH